MSQDYIEIWNRIATFWDEKTAEGNLFYREMIAPFAGEAINSQPKGHVLEVGCSSGLFAVAMAQAGHQVTAIDASHVFIDIARKRWRSIKDVQFLCMDFLAPLPVPRPGPYDQIVSNMVLMDLPDIKKFYQNCNELLKKGGRLVLTSSHPAFNTGHVGFVLSSQSPTGRKGMLVEDYREEFEDMQIGIQNQPEAHKIYHRSLESLLMPGLELGLRVVALRELYLQERRDNEDLCWQNFHQFPPVIGLVLEKP
jgi:SAM-dependent methyltransferase